MDNMFDGEHIPSKSELEFPLDGEDFQNMEIADIRDVFDGEEMPDFSSF